ncbi:MAG TPA: hypothetical protein VIY08_16235 [Candidatus Nitrosocosmicus sp.]
MSELYVELSMRENYDSDNCIHHVMSDCFYDIHECYIDESILKSKSLLLLRENIWNSYLSIEKIIIRDSDKLGLMLRDNFTEMYISLVKYFSYKNFETIDYTPSCFCPSCIITRGIVCESGNIESGNV